MIIVIVNMYGFYYYVSFLGYIVYTYYLSRAHNNAMIILIV